MELEKPVSIFAYAYDVRGTIIHQTIVLERLIDEYLSLHFCTEMEQRIELMDLILGNERLGFEAKKQLFKVISDKSDNIFIYKYPKIHIQITKIQSERNVFAHYLLNTQQDEVDDFKDTISFIKFKDKRTFISYAFQDIADHLKLLDETIDKLTELNNLVRSSLPIWRQ